MHIWKAAVINSYEIFDYLLSSFGADIILCFIKVLKVFNYYFTTVLLTVDRFLVFHLNVSFQLYVYSSKAMNLIVFVSVTSLLTSAIFAVLISMDTITWSQFYGTQFLVCLLFDTGYIFFVIWGIFLYIEKIHRTN